MAATGPQNDFMRKLPTDIAKSMPARASVSFQTFSSWLELDGEYGERGLNDHVIFLTKLSHKKKKQPPIHKKKRLSQSDRKRLGLYKLDKKEVTYSQMTALNHLWKAYMKNLLQVENLLTAKWDNSPQHPMFEAMNMKLYRADFHGAVLTVIKSVCPSLVGCSGIVVMDTKNSFKLVGKDDICRTVPKKTCQFEFRLNELQFTFYGHNFVVRAADRSSKKIRLVRPPTLDT